MTTRRIVFFALGTAVFATGCGTGHERSRREEAPPLATGVTVVAPSPSRDEAETAATLRPFRSASPGTVLMGRVEKILKREGERVRAGESLAIVDSRDATARKAQAEAAVAAAAAAETQARLARGRVERLFAKKAASRRNVEDAVAAHDAAVAALAAAEEGSRAADVYVQYARIPAPFDGVVTRRRIEAGDLAAPGMPLFDIEDLSKLKVEAQVAESAIAGLSVGDAVAVVTESGAARPATLDEILPAGDPASRTFTVKAIVDNADGALRSGGFARLRIPGAAREVLRVPGTAVVTRGPLRGVFVVDDSGVARLRWVTLGRMTAAEVEVLSGLSSGERVVTAPPGELEDGRRVEVR